MLKFNKEKEVIIIGYSGHSIEIISTIKNQGYKIKGYTELSEKKNNPHKLKYLGDENNENFKYYDNKYLFFIAIGDNVVRKNKSKLLQSKGLDLINVIHPDSSIPKNIKMGYGNFISRNASINNFVEIGNGVIINTASVIEHDCIISDGVHVAPGAVLCGGVKVNNNTLIGANSVINQNITIGENVIIGSGSVVINDIPNGLKVYGNPVK
mgnify:FL=1|tara:strand:+ start:12320 stop:12949 length:630 start_codon:yes stop_codon:yes gene_type:complete